MKNLFIKIYYIFFFTFLVIYLNNMIIYPSYVKWKWNKYTAVYNQYVDGIVITNRKDSISLWDKVAYMENKPSIQDFSYKEMIDNFISNKANYTFIKSVNGFILSNYIYDNFVDSINIILNDTEKKYVMSFWFSDEANGQYSIVNNNEESVIEFIKRPSFKGNLKIYLLFDNKNESISTNEVNDFHKHLSSFAREFFAELTDNHVNLNFYTAFTSSFDYYEKHPYHIKSGFLQRDQELSNNCLNGNYYWSYSE